jgi:mannose-6-phosphate isomerase class I
MRVLRFDEGKVDIIHGRDVGNGEVVFPTPAEEFELSRIQCGPDGGYQSGRRNGPDILIVMEGEISASSHGETLHLKAGESFFAPQTASYEITCPSGTAVVFKASVPQAG